MRVDHLCTHFFACDEPEFDVKCKCLHRNVTLNGEIPWIQNL